MIDPWNKTPSQDGFGRQGSAITPDDDNDFAITPKAITVLVEGSLSLVPVDNEDGDTIDYPVAPVGLIPPYIVRRVMQTGTTATVATVDG